MISALQNISLRRVWLVARRDYLGYVKTWGFWISFFLPVIFGAFGFALASSGASFESARYETILDQTGQNIDDKLIAEYASQFDEVTDALSDVSPAIQGPMSERIDQEKSKTIFIAPPADTIEGLQPFLKGELMATHDGKPVKLDGALHVYAANDVASARYWSSNLSANTVPNLARNYFRDRSRSDYLESGGLSLDGWKDAAKTTTKIETFDPTKPITAEGDAQAVTITDRIPGIVAIGASIFLWFTVFSGAYMLLTSMLEEKLGKLMEMMLATTQFAEILLGKLLGVALLTLTAMMPYILLMAAALVGLLLTADADIIEGLRQAFSAKMLIFFPIFLLLGYVFYGSLFIALGSLSESMQDAQTITVPIMIVLTCCLLVVPVGLNDPESPLLQAASWFPLSAPFAAIAGLAADPPWWRLILQALFMVASTIGVAWLATRIFRHGILSGTGVKGLGAWVRRTVLRQSTT